MIQKTSLFSLFLLVFLFSGCGQENKTTMERDFSLNVKTEEQDITYNVKRLAPMLFEGTPKTFDNRLDSIYKRYPQLMDIYTTQVIGIGPPTKDTNKRLLQTFIYDQYWQEVYKATQDTFPNLQAFKDNLNKAFKHYRHYYPDANLPDVYTMVKGIDLRYKVATLERQAIMVFLDMYLGKDYKYYPSQYPDYRIKRFTRSNMVPDIMETIFQERYPKDSLTNRTFLSKMLYKGKKLHFLKSMMPQRHDTAIMRYSLEDWKWCLTFEKKIWDHFVNEELLYETNPKKYTDFLKEAPFTSAGGIPPESPPRLGAFIGWRIILKYRNNNPADFIELMNNQQHKRILTKSGYSP